MYALNYILFRLLFIRSSLYLFFHSCVLFYKSKEKNKDTMGNEITSSVYDENESCTEKKDVGDSQRRHSCTNSKNSEQKEQILIRKSNDNNRKINEELLKSKKRVQRYKPSNAILRNCIYRAQCKFNNKLIPILLELKNTPKCKIVVLNEMEDILRVIYVSDIKLIESSFISVDLFLKIDDEHTRRNQFNLISFFLNNENEKSSFIYNIKMMFGIDVLEYGKVHYDRAISPEKKPGPLLDGIQVDKMTESNVRLFLDDIHKQELFTTLPLQITKEKYNGQRNEDLQTWEHNIDKAKINKSIQTSLQLGGQYNPIVIIGEMEEGSVIEVREINALHKKNRKKMINEFAIVEWFISRKIGDQENFYKKPIHCDFSFLLKPFMIGHYIQAKLSKMIFIDDKKRLVSSINTRGPITINNASAKKILYHISNVTHYIKIYLSTEDIKNIFFSATDSRKQVVGLFIFYPAYLFIMRNGLRFAITLNEQNYTADFLWNSFYLSKKDVLFDKPQKFVPTYFDTRDIHLFFLSRDANGNIVRSVIRTNSFEERDIIYLTVFFYKYQKMPLHFDNWIKDSLSGFYDNFKKRFAMICNKMKPEDMKKIKN